MQSWILAWRQRAAAYMRARFGVAVFAMVLLVSGVVAGSLTTGRLGPDQTDELVRYFHTFLRGFIGGSTMSGPDALRWATWQQFQPAIAIWLLGATVAGVPLVAAILFVRGFIVGFTVGFLVDQLGYRGILFAFVSVLPQNLLAIPAVYILSVAALGFSWTLIRSRLDRVRLPFATEFATYSSLAFGVSFLLVGAALIEAYVTPVLMSLVEPLL